MSQGSSSEITHLLRAWGAGDVQALERLTPLVYDELRRIARRHMAGERSGCTLQSTALAHEAYIRLLGSSHVLWQDRAHFFAICSQLMRRILVDVARTRQSVKRWGHTQRCPLDEAAAQGASLDSDIAALNESLDRLAEFDPRKAKVVELRFFGGLTVDETAEVLKISRQSVLRDWSLARAWLEREMA